MTHAALKHLLDIGFYHQDKIKSKDDIVVEYEIRLSQVIQKNGWKIACLIPEYNQIYPLVPAIDPNPTSNCGDPLSQGALFGRTTHAYELIFIKTNRNLITESALKSLTLSTLNAVSHHPIILNWPVYLYFKQQIQDKLYLMFNKRKSLKSKLKLKLTKKIENW